MRMTPLDIALIKSTFKGNEDALKVLRKVLLPEYDPTAPLGQVIDLWMTVDLKDMNSEQIEIAVKVRNALIQHVEICLLSLNAMANMEELTSEQVAARAAADSSK